MAWRGRFAVVAGLALALLPLAAQGQVRSNPTLTESERGIKDKDDDAARHLRIDALTVTAHVVGRTADVTLEALIGSDSDDAYSAQFELALPADAVVTGYALNVGDTMIPGQLLERPKAREVYEDEVRAGIDPGLAEVSGNRFTTRIYPIDSAHPRRFRLTFVAPFDPDKGLVLPLSREAAIGKVSVTVMADGYESAPLVRFGGEALTLARDGAGWRGSAGGGKRALGEGLEIVAGTLAGPMAVARHSSGERFFAIADSAPAASAKAPPGRLRIYWDRSLSHGRDRRDLEIEALARLADVSAPTGIDLVTFASDRPRVVTLRNSAELRKALGDVVYRGGTSLEGLDGLALPHASRCVLVSDGQVTIDRGAEFAPDCALTLLTASASADGARLGEIAQRNSARLVRAGDGKADETVRALARTGVTVTSVRDDAGRRLPFRALPTASGHWLLVGQMPERGAVHVRLSDGSERRYAAGAAVLADAPGGLWAAQAIVALNDDPARHQAMVDFARRYHVAGPAMSLLVLERPDQYLRAGLAPPPGFSESWMSDYREQKADQEKSAKDDRSERLDFVVGEWQKRTAWWNTRYVVRARPKPRPANGDLVVTASRAPMMAPPPVREAIQAMATAPAETSASASADMSDVVVTGTRRDDSPPLRSQARPETQTPVELDLADLAAHRPYIEALDKAAPADRLTVLVAQERQYGSVPTFYLDTAEWFRLKGDAVTAELLLLSALELPLSDDETRQIVAFRLERDGSYDRAVELTEQMAAATAEFRPQPARDLALALAARGRSHGAAGRADLERAFTLLTDTALNPASSDFDGFEVIALMEANALIPDIEAAKGTWTLDKRLTGLRDTDVRIVIEWTADDADIDLWVDEPNGERVYYGDKLSSAGGQISNDMTDGYGPEEYAIRRAPLGAYSVRINGYDADRINPNGPGHVLIRLIRNFARKGESQTMVDADLSFQKGRNRNDEGEAKPVAVLRVGK